MQDVRCPYCMTDQMINHDDGYGYDQDEIHQQECRACGKTFTYTTSISFDYDVYEAPCLNGGEHEWKRVWHTPRLWPDWKRCKNCGEDDKGEIVENAEAIIRGE